MAFDESISGYSLLDCTLRVPEFSLGTFDMIDLSIHRFSY